MVIDAWIQHPISSYLVAMVIGLAACGQPGDVRTPPPSPDPTPTTSTPAPTPTPTTTDSGVTSPPAPCGTDMVLVDDFCIDAYEAPNVFGADPIVMFTWDESTAWCEARGKRLCFDDEWLRACEGDGLSAYPYGDTHEPGKCNDDEVWRVYNQSLLSLWPWGLPVEDLDTLADVLQAAADAGGELAADHIASLYQAEGSGTNPECQGQWPVYDLVGNVEEWTTRRDGGSTDFHGNLKGRYWSESRTCQSNITSHGDSFRFYEIGFRCCTDPSQ